MRTFHHIGLITTEPQPNEALIDPLKVYVTNADEDKVNHIEWLRFLPESPLADTPVAKQSHVAFVVPDIEAALDGIETVAGPLEPMPGVKIAYFFENDMLVEYMQVNAG